MWDLWRKALVTAPKNGLQTPCAWLLCVCVRAHREQVGELAWSFHRAIFNIWTAHYTAEFKPLVFGMFTEVFPSKTSKPNTGTDPWYLTSIQMGEERAAGWIQEREGRAMGFDLWHKSECAHSSTNRFNTVKLSQLSYYASLKDLFYLLSLKWTSV